MTPNQSPDTLQIPPEQWPFPTYKGIPLQKDLSKFKEPEPEEALF